jgi:methanogenic corrinoid protein MtbC1
MADYIQCLKDLVIDFDIDNAEAVARAAVENGIDSAAVEALTDAIRQVGDAFARGELFLPDLVCASEV